MTTIKQYEDRVAANTPKGYPQLVCGWPDEEHDITWVRYIEHLQNLLDDLDEGDPLPTFETFEHWVDRQRNENEDRDNLGFSHLRCDLCDGLPSDRYAVTALPEDPAKNYDYIPLSVCGDCLQYIANGELPDYLED